MIRINLIPYRAERRQRQILQHLLAALGTLGAVLLVIAGLHLYAGATLSGLEEEFAALSAENRELRKKIGKIRDIEKLREDVENKLALVERLQKGRFRTFETLLGISRAIPENVWLNTFRDSGGKLTLTGLGESNRAVANFMRALDEVEIYDNVNLQVIERVVVNNVAVRRFEISLNRVEPKEGGNEAGKRGGA